MEGGGEADKERIGPNLIGSCAFFGKLLLLKNYLLLTFFGKKSSFFLGLETIF